MPVNPAVNALFAMPLDNFTCRMERFIRIRQAASRVIPATAAFCDVHEAIFRHRRITVSAQSYADAASSCTPTATLQQSTAGHPGLSGNIIKHIPRSARSHCAVQLITTIKEIIAQPEDVTMWSQLLNYGEKLLLVPPRYGRKHNIAFNVVKKRKMDATPTAAVHKPTRLHSTPRSDEGSALATVVRSKLEDSNIRAAFRIVCSYEKPALNNGATLDALRQRQRHPPASANRTEVPDPSSPRSTMCSLLVTTLSKPSAHFRQVQQQVQMAYSRKIC